MNYNSNEVFEPLRECSNLYIKIERVSYRSFPVDNRDTIIACVGARKNFKKAPFKFNSSCFSPNKIWNYKYKNANKHSFVVALFKHKTFGSDVKIGEIELKLDGFKVNGVTLHEFKLRCP